MSNAKPPLDDISLASLHQSVEKTFLERFGRRPSVVVAAPGRVNLIGEHIDYNDGFVLPLALDRYILIAADAELGRAIDSPIRLYSQNFHDTETIATNRPLRPGRTGWVSYVEGVIAGFVELGDQVPTFDAVIGSTVPLGGGLSSSAALEVATATLMEQLTGRALEPIQKALLCQQAEHHFAGVPCGIMDQFSSVFGQPDQLMLIDCRSQQVENVPFDDDDISVLITNTNVKHELTGGEYASRRRECESALRCIGKASWRDVSIDDVNAKRNELSNVEFCRARHVVSEIDRTINAAQAFRNSDWLAAGRLMYASHDSLRDDFEVSCDELDVLVELASDIGVDGGMIGSRMTGGGFGGCSVSLVRNENLESVTQTLISQYESATGIKPNCFSCRPSLGAHVRVSKN